LKITYSTLIKGDIGEEVEIENEVEILANSEFTTNFKLVRRYTIPYYSSWAFSEEESFTLVKKDSETEMPLANAEFAVYLYAVGVEATEDVPPDWWVERLDTLPNGVPQKIVVGDKVFYSVVGGYGITDKNGTITFTSTMIRVYSTWKDLCYYAVVELSAPDGYTLPDKPITIVSKGPLEEIAGMKVNRIETDNFTVYNTLSLDASSPETGDSYNMVIWLVVLTSLVCCCYELKKIRNKAKENS